MPKHAKASPAFNAAPASHLTTTILTSTHTHSTTSTCITLTHAHQQEHQSTLRSQVQRIKASSRTLTHSFRSSPFLTSPHLTKG